MTQEQAKRAAFLIKALEDIEFDLDVPASSRTEEIWKYGLKPLSMCDHGFKFKLSMCERGNGGAMHNIVTIDVGLATKACQFLVVEIRRELRELGVEVE